MANKINVLECGPRDGWQNLKQMLTFDQKMDLIDRMFDAGVTQMEVTSFVSPKAIPQMADAADVAKACIEKHLDATLYALVPNFRGVENAFNAGIRNVSYVISVSESHNKANIRRTHRGVPRRAAEDHGYLPADEHLCRACDGVRLPV